MIGLCANIGPGHCQGQWLSQLPLRMLYALREQAVPVMHGKKRDIFANKSHQGDLKFKKGVGSCSSWMVHTARCFRFQGESTGIRNAAHKGLFIDST